MASASSGERGLPRIASPRTTTVSAARTSRSGCRRNTASAFAIARRSTAWSGGSPSGMDSSTAGGSTVKRSPADARSSWRRGEADARMSAGVSGMRSDELRIRLERTLEEIEAFTEIGKVLTSTLDIHEVLRRIMDKVREVLKPANWSLLLVDPAGESLVFEVAEGPGAERLTGERIGLGEGIAGWVVARGQPLLVEDVRKDPRFSSRFDAATLFTTRSILAAPLRYGERNL